MKTITIMAVLALTGCASTKLYNQKGERIAAFQGDMTDLDYSMAADGSVRWSASTISHSSATKAYGESSTGRIQALGAAAATAPFLLK